MMVTDSVTDVQVVYVTCPDIEVARLISRDLIENKFAACTNILPGMESHYVWDGNYQQDKEVVLLIKSVENQFDNIQKRVSTLHPYKLPCVLALKVAQGSLDYLKWVTDSCR